MIRKPIFSFDGTTSTGVNEVPVYGLISIENYDGLGTPKYVTLLDKTGIDATYTIADLLADNSKWVDFGAPEVIDLSNYARKDIAETHTHITSSGLASTGNIDFLDFDDAIGFDTGIRTEVHDGVLGFDKMPSEPNPIVLKVEGNTVYHEGNISSATGLNASTLNSFSDTDFIKTTDNPTVTGQWIFSNTTDLSHSTNGAITVGALNSYNLTIDPNEIEARLNGGPANLNLNRDGGNVHINSTLASVGDLYVRGSKVLTESTGGAGAKAFIWFNGSVTDVNSTVVGKNILSVTDNGTGDYTIYFTSGTFSTSTYAVAGIAGGDSYNVSIAIITQTSSYIRVRTGMEDGEGTKMNSVETSLVFYEV